MDPVPVGRSSTPTVYVWPLVAWNAAYSPPLTSTVTSMVGLVWSLEMEYGTSLTSVPRSPSVPEITSADALTI